MVSSRDLQDFLLCWYRSVISPSSTLSQMKWCLPSMCLVRAWKIRFFGNLIDPWLSQWRWTSSKVGTEAWARLSWMEGFQKLVGTLITETGRSVPGPIDTYGLILLQLQIRPYIQLQWYCRRWWIEACWTMKRGHPKVRVDTIRLCMSVECQSSQKSLHQWSPAE